MDQDNKLPDTAPRNPERRTFMSVLSSIVMVTGLAAGYGMLAHLAGRFLYPARPPRKAWLYVAIVKAMKAGDSLAYRTPSGARVAIARKSVGSGVDDFIALSSTCPHLGCQVHWEGQKNRFFCPCHNGVFDPDGRGTAGPPADAGQSLEKYSLKIENGLLYIQVEEGA